MICEYTLSDLEKEAVFSKQEEDMESTNMHSKRHRLCKEQACDYHMSRFFTPLS